MLKNTGDVVKAVKYAVRTRGAWAKFVAENPDVTRENIAEVARALATLAYPKDEPVQKVDGKRTRYGNAVQAAGNGLRSVLDKADSTDTVTDWTKLVRQAVENARVKGEVPTDAIAGAVADALGYVMSGDTAGGITLYPAQSDE